MTDGKKNLTVEKDPLFRIEYVDGVTGGINYDQGIGWLQFHSDQPNVKFDSTGAITDNELSRHLIIDLRMSFSTFKTISAFMENQIKAHEEQSIAIKKIATKKVKK